MKQAASKGSILVIQSAPSCGPGILTRAAKSARWHLNVVKAHRGDSIPLDPRPHAGVVLLGGSINVYDVARNPHLADERTLLRRTLDLDVPVLGICLGARIIAEMLGTPVVPAPAPEQGWYPVCFTRDAPADPLLKGLTDDLMAFQWRADTFALPAAAVPLAWSRRTDCLGFRWGARVHAFQFHLEVDQDGIDRMMTVLPVDVLRGGQRPSEMRECTARHLATLNQFGSTLLSRWMARLDLVRDGV